MRNYIISFSCKRLSNSQTTILVIWSFRNCLINRPESPKMINIFITFFYVRLSCVPPNHSITPRAS
jgi:hypothetical protein